MTTTFQPRSITLADSSGINEIPPEEVATDTLEPTILATTNPTTTTTAVDEDALWEAEIAKAKEQKVTPPIVEQPTINPVEVPPVKNTTVEKLEDLFDKQFAPKPTPPIVVAPKDAQTEKQQTIANENNIGNLLFTHIGTDDELVSLCENVFKDDGRTLEEIEADPTEAIAKVGALVSDSMSTKQQKLLTQFISALNTNNVNLEQLTGALRFSTIRHTINNKDSNGPKKLTGNAAKMMIAAKTSGLYRIMLYNSGFWISVRPITVADADNFTRAIDMERTQLGKIIGGHSHLAMGVFLKQRLAEILLTLIMGSNLEGWENPEILLNSISIQDYDNIVWALCCMLYREGIGISVTCTNPECRHEDDSQFVDLTKACWFNPTTFNKGAMEWMLQINKSRTEEQLKHYRENILNGVRKITTANGSMEYVLKTPSLNSMIELGTILVGKMAATVYGAKNTRTEDTRRTIIYNIYKMLAPWISQINILEDKEVIAEISETDAILESLSSSRVDLEQEKFFMSTEEFIRDTRCTFFGLTTLKCAKCGKTPKLNQEDIYPLDIEYIFFALTCLLLQQQTGQMN